MYQWLILLHVAAVLAFMLAHGTHVAVMWRMRAEADPEVSLTLFNTLSSSLTLRVLLAVIVGSGVLAGFTGSWWSRGWMWASLVVLAGISVAMWRYGGSYWDAVQNAATRAVEARSSEPPDAAAQRAFDAARGGWQTVGLSVIGLGGLAVILWLMMFKPF
jgi:hypothetical protein